MKNAVKALIAQPCHFATEFLKISRSFGILNSREMGCKVRICNFIA